MRRVVAAIAHETPDRPPLQLAAGDAVMVGEHDTEWPAFVFVTASHGSGWVPRRHLSVGRGAGFALTAYDTTELATAVGDVLRVVVEDRESGWLWCRTTTGSEGWVPMKTVREIAAEEGHDRGVADQEE